MASTGARGMPLLSGPPTRPPLDLDVSCRKCNKDLRGVFTREVRCSHCGYMYCTHCAPFTALMPRSGDQTGYDPAPACSFCMEYLTITAAGRSHLKALPLARLRKYIDAYNLKANGVVEKGELVDVIVGARGVNGCLRPENEEWYRRNSVPTSQTGAPRGFLQRTFGNAPPAQARLQRPLSTRRSTPNFARPDLDRSDDPPAPAPATATANQPRYNPPPGPPPGRPAASPPRPPPQQRQQPPPRAAPPPRPRSATTHSQARPTPPPPPASAPVPPPAPPPTLDELLGMSPEAVRALSVHALKAVLFANHVRPGAGVLEKGELVARVLAMLEDERKEREREAARRAEEEAVEAQMRAAFAAEREAAERRRQEAAERAAAPAPERATGDTAAAQDTPAPADATVAPVPAQDERPTPPDADVAKPLEPTTAPVPPAAPPSPPKNAAALTAQLERTGLCVVCQDSDANMAIIDCGHLAMCRGCADLIMANTRECPLCRTRIVTEARLLRIFKT